MRIVRTFEWDSAHRITRHSSLCRFIHGHRYKAEVELEAKSLDELGRAIDFGLVKEIVWAWIAAHWDHNTLARSDDETLIAAARMCGREPFMFECEPTAESIALELFAQTSALFKAVDENVHVTRIRVYETPNCWAEVP